MERCVWKAVSPWLSVVQAKDASLNGTRWWTELKGVKRLGLEDVWIAWMRARRTRSRRHVESGDGIASAAWRPVSNFSLALTSCVVLGKLVHFPAPVSSSVRWER